MWVEPRGTSEVDEPFTSYDASSAEPQPVEVIRVTVDQSVQVVMPGEPHFSCDGDDLDVHFAFGAVPSSSQTSTCSGDVTERPWAFWMYASPDVMPLSSVQANGAAIGVWIDDGLAAATRAAVFDHVLVEMQGDLEFLQERLGVLGGVDHLVFVRPTPTEGSSFRGRGGGMFVRAFQANGDLHAGGDFRATTVHEMAHRWFGGRREAAADARWVEEGMPTLLAIMRYPLGPHRSRQLFEGLVRMGRTATDPGLTADLETDSHVDSVVYDLGAYTLAQLHATLRGRDPLKTHADIWAEWRDFLSVGDPGNQFAASDVEAFLQSLWLEPGPAGSSSFYAEWIETGRVGTPLLGIREFEYGGPGPTDVRWVEVHQAQVDELGWPVFTDVPYQLACDSLPELGKRSFAECQRGWELEVAPPGLLGSRSAGAGSAVERIDLTPNPALNDPAAAMPSFLALISNQMLLPESIAYGDVLGGQPRGGGEEPPAETWLWRCSPLGMPHPRCDLTQNDADLDGYATLEDCDDLDASVHPDADQTPWAFTAQPVDDENCDGWPSTAFWGTP